MMILGTEKQEQKIMEMGEIGHKILPMTRLKKIKGYNMILML